MKFRKLFSPCRLGKLELSNRIVLSPVTTFLATEDGFVTDRMVDFYSEVARGGASLLIVEDSIVQAPVGRHDLSDVVIDDDKYIPGMRRIAEAIKKEGAKACVQISHAGMQAGRLFTKPGTKFRGQLVVTEGQISVAPSSIGIPVPGFVVPRELTVEQIEEIEDKFAEAAWRVKEAGFDMVSLHGTHWYLINDFLSPYLNRRQDAYGGDFERRLRFFLEIIEKVKNKVGDDFPLFCRISGEDCVRGGLTIEDTRRIARRLEAAGMHGISVSFGHNPAMAFKTEYFPPILSAAEGRNPRGELVHLASAVKDVVSIPVMTSSRILTPQQAEQILEQEKADLIGIARGLMADPEWPKKAQAGKEKEIRHCILCHLGCGAATGCTVNPRLGRERETQITPAIKTKTVFIAGGGPAGLEAARVAALRGHKVSLYEKGKLGGQLNLSCVPPGKDDYRLFLNFEQEQLKILGVKIENRELTLDIIRQDKPDAVIVATGSLPARPDIPGSNNENVITAWQVLEGYIPKGKVVVIGGRQIGAETADYLAAKGNEVTLVEAQAEIASDARDVFKILQLSLESQGVKILTNATVEEITKTGVVVNRKGRRFSLDADTVVLQPKHKPNRQLANQLEKLDIELHVIGDCAGVGKMVKAVKEGFHAGLVV